MIYGIGTDIVQISRMETKLNRSGDAFAQSILSMQEWTQYISFNERQKVAFLAKRFAAKEALVKALRTGFREPNLLSNISVLNDENNAPYFSVSNGMEEWLNNKNIKKLHLTISDEKDYAIAFVVAEI